MEVFSVSLLVQIQIILHLVMLAYSEGICSCSCTEKTCVCDCGSTGGEDPQTESRLQDKEGFALVLKAEEINTWGDWGEWERCGENTYAAGFQLRADQSWTSFNDYNTDKDNDYHGVVAIRLFCVKLGSNKYNEGKQITSKQSNRGDWKLIYRCREGVLTGFNIAADPPGKAKDQKATVNIRMICSNPQIGTLIGDGDLTSVSRWGGQDQHCEKKQAICGIRTQVETQGKDISGINSVQMGCCDIRDPASTCIPEDGWKEVISCDNTVAKSDLICVYEYMRGTFKISSSSVSGSSVSQIISNIGFSQGGSLGALEANFQGNMTHTTVSDWSKASSEVFSEATIVRLEFSVPSGKSYVAKQVEGICGDYLVSQLNINLTEFDKSGKALQSKMVNPVELSARGLSIFDD